MKCCLKPDYHTNKGNTVESVTEEGKGCPWLSPPGMPATVEISEATYNEFYLEVVKKSWQMAAGRFPASTAWPRRQSLEASSARSA